MEILEPLIATAAKTDEQRQITNQKHKIYVENTDCRLDKARKICYFAILLSSLHLQSLNLILVTSCGKINFNVNHCRKNKTNNSKKNSNK